MKSIPNFSVPDFLSSCFTLSFPQHTQHSHSPRLLAPGPSIFISTTIQLGPSGSHFYLEDSTNSQQQLAQTSVSINPSTLFSVLYFLYNPPPVDSQQFERKKLTCSFLKLPCLADGRYKIQTKRSGKQGQVFLNSVLPLDCLAWVSVKKYFSLKM